MKIYHADIVSLLCIVCGLYYHALADKASGLCGWNRVPDGLSAGNCTGLRCTGEISAAR